ncbi:cysteine proteinase [Coniochaeta sp. PMI_546]|nr:cysteine proteinase [Coniochaeta sp. PMI_546]
MSTQIRLGKGWEKQPVDDRDLIYSPPAGLHIKSSVDLRDTHHMQREPYQQGSLGSCTANAIASALQHGKLAEAWGPRNVPYLPSRLFIWYHEHVLNVTDSIAPPADELAEVLYTNKRTTLTITDQNGKQKTVTRDAILQEVKSNTGAFIRDGFKTVIKYGFCSETTWPYNEKDFWTVPEKALQEAKTFAAPEFTYWRIPDYQTDGVHKADVIPQMEAALSEGYAIVFAFSGSNISADLGLTEAGVSIGLDDKFVYKGWIKDGESREDIWGHAVLCVGYHHKNQQFLILNSWGPKFGNKGYFYMPYRWFDAKEGIFTTSQGDKWARTNDLWVLKSPRQAPGTAGSDVTRETSLNK